MFRRWPVASEHGFDLFLDAQGHLYYLILWVTRAGYVLWLEWKLLGFQGLIPCLNNLCDLAGAVGSREEGCFGNSLGLEEYLNTAICITNEVGGLESNIILSVELCVCGHTLECFQISTGAVEKELGVVV